MRRTLLLLASLAVLGSLALPGTLAQAAFVMPTDTWCQAVSNKLKAEPDSGRVWIENPILLQSVKDNGGRCEVPFGAPTRISLNNSQGEVWDGATRLTSWNGIITVSHLIIVYSANNQANGFELWVQDIAPTPTPSPTATPWPRRVHVPLMAQLLPTATTEFRFDSQNATLCTVHPRVAPPGSTGAFHFLMQRNDNRIWMDEGLQQLVKEQWRSTCSIYFTSRTLFYYDSVAGTILIDGQSHPQGNRMPGVGTWLRVDYEAGSSNGLAVYKRT